ncbi:hypothetical protein [Spirillospora sp. NPDC047279]|uniref:hypothetical protein n=1 Tax=Spirillospora sp. NPDC047279 TaxID=3155478 RepID=UPI00340F766C
MARSGFYAAFDAVERLAASGNTPGGFGDLAASGSVLRVGEPYIPGPPRGGRRASADVRGGSPEALTRLAAELGRAGRGWQDAGRALAHILGGLGLGTGPAQDVVRAGEQVTARQAGIARRRDELLRADDRAGRAERGRRLWNDYTRHYLPGFGEGTRDVGLTAMACDQTTASLQAMADPDGWMKRGPIGQFAGLVHGAQHPVAFPGPAVGWDLWGRDPGRLHAPQVPSLIIGAVTRGAP